MSQCVPSWDLDDNMKLTSQSESLYLTSDVPTLDYEVAELTWENGHLSLHGLGQPKVPYNIWDKPCLGGTLESVVDQATFFPDPISVGDATNELLPLTTAVGTATGVLDAQVPCNDNNNMVEGSSTRVMNSGLGKQVESCRDVTGQKVRVDHPPPSTQGNANSAKHFPANDHDSVCQSNPQGETGDAERKKKTSDKSSISTKRRRAAAVHNQSERKRRDKINQRMQTLQKMVPRSSKIDKASMLDEVIDYMKQLQAQVNMMSKMNMSPMALQQAMQQQLQMSVMAPMMGMGMGHVIDMNTAMALHPNMVAASPSVLHPIAHRLHTPAPAMLDSMYTFLAAGQSQPMTMDAYSRMATIYQHMNQNPGPGIMK
ncbi:transcription factor UNE10-like [Apium graveolens]|uniref:transcription factor UNE10-like n=1 Tax=Apium graveolens TaxID=4045 RepID=UPI003D7B8627